MSYELISKLLDEENKTRMVLHAEVVQRYLQSGRTKVNEELMLMSKDCMDKGLAAAKWLNNPNYTKEYYYGFGSI